MGAVGADGHGDAARMPPTRMALFMAFAKIGCLGFGGVAALARHVLVNERCFVTAREFADAFSLASALPGANTVNLAAMLGDRYRGVTGAAASLTGLLGVPLVILAGIAAAYARLSNNADVQAGLDGAAAAAAGLVLGTSLNMAKGLGLKVPLVLTAVAVAAATLLGSPVLVVLLCAIPGSMLLRVAAARLTMP